MPVEEKPQICLHDLIGADRNRRGPAGALHRIRCRPVGCAGRQHDGPRQGPDHLHPDLRDGDWLVTLCMRCSLPLLCGASLIMLTSVFNTLFTNVEMRRVRPVNYKLFQVADLICTMEMLEDKADHNGFSKSETEFFGSAGRFNKDYYRKVKGKRL